MVKIIQVLPNKFDRFLLQYNELIYKKKYRYYDIKESSVSEVIGKCKNRGTPLRKGFWDTIIKTRATGRPEPE